MQIISFLLVYYILGFSTAPFSSVHNAGVQAHFTAVVGPLVKSIAELQGLFLGTLCASIL